jgi:hypothetical protein
MVKKQLSAEQKKKVEVVDLDLAYRQAGLVDEDHTAADLMEIESQLTAIDQDILPAEQVQTHCTRPVVLRGRLQQDHLETGLPALVGQDHLVSHDEQVDQAPLLADQDQIGRIYFHKQKQTTVREIINPHIIVCFH